MNAGRWAICRASHQKPMPFPQRKICPLVRPRSDTRRSRTQTRPTFFTSTVGTWRRGKKTALPRPLSSDCIGRVIRDGSAASLADLHRLQRQHLADVTDPRNFDNSEFIAWQSAAGLRNKLKDLNAEYPGHVYMLAHSMGNIVAGEALQLAAQNGDGRVVNTYVASQAALPAHDYDATVTSPYLLPFTYTYRAACSIY